MSGLTSPDLPAYLCYAIVLVVGALIARARVRTLLTFSDRWAFGNSWLLFGAHVMVPLTLFWLLDYTSALNDTSLFAALVVATGYSQIMSGGGFQGYAMPGQTSAMWKPFQDWVQGVTDRIATKHKQYQDRFAEAARTAISLEADRVACLESLALRHSTQPDALKTALDALKPGPNLNFQKVNLFWQDLFKSEPDNYGYLMSREVVSTKPLICHWNYRKRLISLWSYWWWLGNGRAKVVSGVFSLLGLFLLFMALAMIRGSVVIKGVNTQTTYKDEYYQWRFRKPNASERDLFRSRKYLGSVLTKTGDRICEAFIPLVDDLGFKSVPPVEAARVLRLIVDFHSPTADSVVIPALIETLRTENADNRLRINQTLLDLQKADFPSSEPDKDLSDWVPKKDESAAAVDARVQAWLKWWAKQPGHAAGAASPCGPTTLVQTLPKG
jgi:hypothetical protein